MKRIPDVPDFYEYLHSIEKDGKLSHLAEDNPKIIKLREMLGYDSRGRGVRVILNKTIVRSFAESRGKKLYEVSVDIGNSPSWLNSLLTDSQKRSDGVPGERAIPLANYFDVPLEVLGKVVAEVD